MEVPNIPPGSPEVEGIEQLTPSQEIAEILRGIGEDFGFDQETCDEIAELPVEEAFETAYGYLLQAPDADFDPDKLLADFQQDPQTGDVS